VRHLYLAATGQNRGKTTASLGLVHAFIEAGLRTGFTKPVGPRSGSGGRSWAPIRSREIPA